VSLKDGLQFSLVWAEGREDKDREVEWPWVRRWFAAGKNDLAAGWFAKKLGVGAGPKTILMAINPSFLSVTSAVRNPHDPNSTSGG